jgi:hypothetical protein
VYLTQRSTSIVLFFGNVCCSEGSDDPINNADPTGLSELFFDGSSVEFFGTYGDYYGPASSGQVGSTAADQGRSKFGPIPEGTYFLDPNDISSVYGWNYLWRGFGGLKHGYLWEDWGNNRVRLYPTGNTNTYGRSNFFLYGGRSPGSFGCIDVGTGEDELFGLLSLEWYLVDVDVHYPFSNTATTPSPKAPKIPTSPGRPPYF